MILQWQPVLPYTKIIEVEKSMESTQNYSGIYIWGFSVPEGFIPYYAGKAGDICDRLCSHINNLKGGAYTIYTKEALQDIKSNEPFYRPDSVEKRVQFVANNYPAPGLQQHVDYMISHFSFTYAPMSYAAFRESGANAERHILNWLKDILGNTRIGPDCVTIDKGNIKLVNNKYLEIGSAV